MFNYSTNFDLADGGFVRERNLDDGDMRQRLARYTTAMGVSSGLITLAEHTSPDVIHVLTPAEIARWRLGSANSERRFRRVDRRPAPLERAAIFGFAFRGDIPIKSRRSREKKLKARVP